MEILHADLLGIYTASQAQPNVFINIVRRSQQGNSVDPQKKFPLQNSVGHNLQPAVNMHKLSSILTGQWKGRELVPLTRAILQQSLRKLQICIFLQIFIFIVRGSGLYSSAQVPGEETLSQISPSGVPSNSNACPLQETFIRNLCLIIFHFRLFFPQSQILFFQGYRKINGDAVRGAASGKLPERI